jgi:hypothetical protein
VPRLRQEDASRINQARYPVDEDELMATSHELAYAAGIVDGEGTIGVTEVSPSHEPGDRKRRRKSPSFRAYIGVVMCDPEIPTLMAELFGGTVHTYPARKVGHSPQTHWRIAGERAASACESLLPYLRLKRPQAQLVIDFMSDPRCRFAHTNRGVPLADITHRRQYVIESKHLNQRGVAA